MNIPLIINKMLIRNGATNETFRLYTEKTVANIDTVIANKTLQEHNTKIPRFFRIRSIDPFQLLYLSTEDGSLPNDVVKYIPKPTAGNNYSTKKTVEVWKLKSNVLSNGPEIIANPIDVKSTPNILPLLVGIAKSHIIAVIIGEKRVTAMPPQDSNCKK